MPNKVHTVLHYVLLPLSWLYGMVTGVRNWLFDHNVLPQEEYDVPVITVGNLTVGGTGKTPSYIHKVAFFPIPSSAS